MEKSARPRKQIRLCRGPSETDRLGDPAAARGDVGTRSALTTFTEFVGSPAAKRQMCVAIDETRDHQRAVSIFAGRFAELGGQIGGSSGKHDAARRILAALSERKKKGEYISPLLFAFITADLDDRDHTFHWLEAAFVERNDYLLYLPIAPEFTHLHNDPRFQSLLRRVTLET